MDGPQGSFEKFMMWTESNITASEVITAGQKGV